jgi:acetate kinase
MNVLVLNAGSSSLKFQLIRTDQEHIAADTDERWPAADRAHRRRGAAHASKRRAARCDRSAAPVRDHRAAVETALRWLARRRRCALGGFRDIDAVGHRVVHGGEHFSPLRADRRRGPARIEETIDLAPLHNPHNLKGIQAVRACSGGRAAGRRVRHRVPLTLPDHAYLYAIPYSLYRRHRVRRYGFHGTSHRYVAYRYRRLTGTPREDTRLITLHLGNGCSACAIVGRRLGGHLHGLHAAGGAGHGHPLRRPRPRHPRLHRRQGGHEPARGGDLLNKQSGLLGIRASPTTCANCSPRRDEHDDRRARLAIEIFCYRARKYIGAYLAAIGGAHAVVFTGGIGENSPRCAPCICSTGWSGWGSTLDADANARAVGGVQARITTRGGEARTPGSSRPTRNC